MILNHGGQLTGLRVFLFSFILVLSAAGAKAAQSRTNKNTHQTESVSAAAYFNLSDFGPIADGVGDDGPAFQRALDALAAAGGGTLFVPAGKYLIATPVVKDFSGVEGPVTIQGVPSLTMPAPPSAQGQELAAGLDLTTDITPATGAQYNTITLTNIKHLLIQDLGFTGRPSEFTDAFIVVNLSDIDDATIRHCEFYGLSSMGGGNIVRATRTNLSMKLSVFLGCTANSGGYAPVVENVEWRGFSISNSIFLDYGLRTFFGKTGLGAPFSWINIAKAADPTPAFPRREFVVHDLFLDEGGWIGITATPHRWGIPLPQIDLVYITGLKMNVSNFATFGHAFYEVRDVMIENSKYGWSHNASAAITLVRVGNAIFDNLVCEADATHLQADNLTQRLTVINSQYEQLDSEAQTTTVIQTSPENDPVQFVRSQFQNLLGRAPDPAAHFYWSDLLIRCGQDNQCLDQVRSQLNQYLAGNPQPTFKLAGTLVDDQGEPLSGATVQLTGSHNVTMLSDAAGHFSFERLPTSGNYTITASQTHISFAPPTRTVSNPAGDQNVVFTGSWNRHTISGRISTIAGSGLADVTVSVGGSTTTTDEDGNYSFPELLEGNNYSVVPTFANFAFTPTSKDFVDLSADQTADFVGNSLLKTISGRIVTASGVGLQGIQVGLSQSAASVTTDENGHFSLANLVQGQSYTLTPVSSEFGFTPASRTFDNLSADQTVEFVAKRLPHIMTVEDSDLALALASVTFVAQPFSMWNELDFSPDGMPRVIVFVSNLDVDDVAQVSATVEDGSGNTFGVPIEFLGNVPGQGWLKQLNLKLTDNIPTGTNLRLRISIAEGSSNPARLMIPASNRQGQ